MAVTINNVVAGIAASGASAADELSYDNDVSNLTAEDVQAAIDEVSNNVDNLNIPTVVSLTNFVPDVGSTPNGSTFTSLMTIGNGEITGAYAVVGNVMFLWAKIVWGNTTTVDNGSLWIALPPGYQVDDSDGAGGAQQYSLGLMTYHDAGSAVYTGAVGYWQNDPTKLKLAANLANATYQSIDIVDEDSPTVPAANDEIYMSATIPVTTV